MQEPFVFSSRLSESGDGEYAMHYHHQQLAIQRQRRQVEHQRQFHRENYWRENIDRVKRTSPGYCRRAHGPTAIFRGEECLGYSRPTYREHPTIPGLQVEDVCKLCDPRSGKARRDMDDDSDEESAIVYRKSVNPEAVRRRRLAATSEEESMAIVERLKNARRRALRKSMDERRDRNRRKVSGHDRNSRKRSSRYKKITNFGGMVLFTNQQKAPKKNVKKVSKKKTSKKKNVVVRLKE